MKPALVTLLFLLLATIGRAHEYFFAFAEVEYNADKEALEMTLESAAHDVVKALQAENIEIADLSKHYNDNGMNASIERAINQHLLLSFGTANAYFHLDGYEVLPNGLVFFYLSSDKIQPGNQMTCRFDWLMNEFPEQQNKLTLTIHTKKYTAVFLNQQPVVMINLHEE